MADADLDLGHVGGRFNLDGNALLTADDIDRIGSMAQQGLLGFLAMLFMDSEIGRPLAGFPRDEDGRDHCLVTATGDLTFSVASGYGLYYDSSALGSDEFGPNGYLPVVVDAAFADALDAHDGSNPRIDIVCVAPAYVDDQSATRNVKNPTTGVISSTSISQRRRYGYAYQIVTGTPAAEPSPPAVPSGYMEIGRARVPAGSGAATWSDSRRVLTFGNYFRAMPAYVQEDHVPAGAASELLVAADSPASMYLRVTAGRANINGTMRGYPNQRVQIATADATNPRIDLISALQSTNVIQVTTGTPGSSPSAPSLPADSITLAEVAVGAAVSSISSGDITDTRVRQPFANASIQSRSLNHNKLEVRTALAKIISTGSTASNTRSFTVGVIRPDGSDLNADDGAVSVEIRIAVAAAGTVSGAGYDLTDADWTMWVDDSTVIATNPLYGIRDDDAAGDIYFPRLVVGVTPGTARNVSVRRLGGAVVGTIKVMVRALGSDDGSTEQHVVGGGDDEFSFIFT